MLDAPGVFEERAFKQVFKRRLFTKPAGQARFAAEAIWVDRSYLHHYHFVNIYVRMRREGGSWKTELVPWREFMEWKTLKGQPAKELLRKVDY